MVQRSRWDISAYVDACATSMLALLRQHDEESADHCERVGSNARRLAERLHWADHRVRQVTLAARLHDLGKCAIDQTMLRDHGRWTDEQKAAMRVHPRKSEHVLSYGVSAGFVPPVVSAVALQHHERLDGSGYPAGLSNGQIVEEARLVAVADIMDAAMRPHSRMSTHLCIAELSHIAGSGKLDLAFCNAAIALLAESGG